MENCAKDEIELSADNNTGGVCMQNESKRVSVRRVHKSQSMGSLYGIVSRTPDSNSTVSSEENVLRAKDWVDHDIK